MYHDINGDGIREADETGYAGVTVSLTGTNDLQSARQRPRCRPRPTGRWRLSNLVAGHYVIKETQPLIYLEGLDHIGTEGILPRSRISSPSP